MEGRRWWERRGTLGSNQSNAFGTALRSLSYNGGMVIIDFK